MHSPPTIAWTRAQEGIIKRMHKQWIPGSFSPRLPRAQVWGYIVKQQSALTQLFALTLQNVNKKSCAHEYNYVVNFFTGWIESLTTYNYIHVHSFSVHILQTAVIDFVVWASRVPILQGQRKLLYRIAICQWLSAQTKTPSFRSSWLHLHEEKLSTEFPWRPFNMYNYTQGFLHACTLVIYINLHPGSIPSIIRSQFGAVSARAFCTSMEMTATRSRMPPGMLYLLRGKPRSSAKRR